MNKEKHYINNQIKWLKDHIDTEIKSVRQAVDKVERTNADYRDTQNEWRAQIKDIQGQNVTRRELWGAVIAIIAIVLSFLSYIK